MRVFENTKSEERPLLQKWRGNSKPRFWRSSSREKLDADIHVLYLVVLFRVTGVQSLSWKVQVKDRE